MISKILLICCHVDVTVLLFTSLSAIGCNELKRVLTIKYLLINSQVYISHSVYKASQTSS